MDFLFDVSKIPQNEVIADSGRGSCVESGSECCQAGIIQSF